MDELLFSTIKSILKNRYLLEDITSIKKFEDGFRNDCFKIEAGEDSYVFIIYKREEGIEQKIVNAHEVAIYLSKKGFPTRVPILSKYNKYYFREEFKGLSHFVALYNFLEGISIPWEEYTKRHLKSIGKTLSDMHFVLKKGGKDLSRNLPLWSDEVKEEITEMKKYFKAVEPWVTKKLKLTLDWGTIKKIFDVVVKLGESESNQNVLHYDFVRGNILFSNKVDESQDIYAIKGIIDFEKVCEGPEKIDIARSLAFLIVDCKYKSEEKIKKRFLRSGYEKRGKNKLGRINNFTNLLKYFWLVDFWKFLVHNPYEYLHMNEHYVRTKDLLVRARILKRVKV